MKLSIKSTNVSRNTQETALARALQFLRAVGTDASIMESLKQTGFSEAAQKQGWSLVLTAYAATGPIVASITEAPLTEATDKVEAWQDAMFVRANAALGRLHSEQNAFVFTNLEPGSGIGAVPAVATFLDRLDALESAPERKSTRKADHAALDTLAERGITKDARKEMRGLVKWVESNQAQPLATHKQSPREAALTAVYGWVQDWTDCARTVITRRDQLIRLGIGKRRARKQDAAPMPPAPVVTPVPPPVVSPAPIVVSPAPSDTSSSDPTLIQASRVLALPVRLRRRSTPGSIAIAHEGGH